MIDSHTHLTSCQEGADVLVARARQVGITRMLTVGTRPGDWQAVIALTEQFDEVYAAVGLHPNEATGYDPAVIDELRTLAAHPKVAAIGETGLDQFRDYAPIADQRRAFVDHIALARELSKPLVVHTRAADEETLATLREHAQGVDVILHCFSMPARVEACVAEGWWISFAGNVTYPANAELAAAVASVPDDRLLVETDAPYLTPVPHRKERNRPDLVMATAEFLAEQRGTTDAALSAQLTANAAALFGWAA